ncbi:transcription initiation factor TFIID subunit 4-like [Arapaima gigas]
MALQQQCLFSPRFWAGICIVERAAGLASVSVGAAVGWGGGVYCTGPSFHGMHPPPPPSWPKGGSASSSCTILEQLVPGTLASSASSVIKQPSVQRVTRVNLRDLVFCMEQDPALRHSLCLYQALL